MIKIHSLIEWEIGLVHDFTNTNSSNSGCARQGAGGGLSVVYTVVLFLPSREGVLGIQGKLLNSSSRGEERVESYTVCALYHQKGCLAGAFIKAIVNTPCLCQKSKRRKSSIEKKCNCRIPVCLFSSSDHWS